MKIECTLQEINRAKQVATFVVMMSAMLALIWYDLQAYTLLMAWIGALAVGMYLGNWARKKWPTT